MARAFSHPRPEAHDPEPQPGEWQALRGELVALLDQVESQVARVSHRSPEHGGLAERMQALRHQVEEPDPRYRHREALRTVRQAVDRFSDRDESYGAAPAYPPNPQDSLRSAIQQIRSRHAEQAPPAPRKAEPQFGELAQAVTGISGRLERLEGELRTQGRSQTGNIKEIADQVAQLSHVVELLAGAVGETGQVKRLEAQIAGLAKLIGEGPQVDLSALTQRLDDVTSTIGRLADLQVQVVERVDRPADVPGIDAIEAGVRNIYDRIDAIEKNTALHPADLERLTDEMARFTEAMRNPVQPQGLVELIDDLNTRIGDIESQHGDVGGLKSDLEQLREIVVAAVDSRFSALEMQIETLAGRMDERPADIGVGQLEAQVRQLVARMDQTGEQLSGLAKLYNKREPQPEPDYEALADMVASRTSDAIAQSSAAAGTSLNEAGMAEIEARLSRLLEDREAPGDELDDMQSGIREVNERLARLEETLTARAREAATAAPERAAAAAPAAEPPLMPVVEAILPPISPEPPAPAVPPAAPPRQRRSDAMPKNPVEEAPLTDKPFEDPGLVRAALDAKESERKRHPGLDRRQVPSESEQKPEPAVSASEGEARPVFDPTLVARPPRPTSSLGAPEPGAAPHVEAAPPAPAAPEAEPPVSANTFIAAARRAAQRQQGQKQQPSAEVRPASAETGSGSLIARAITSFQKSRAHKSELDEPTTVPDEPKPAKKPKSPPKASDAPTTDHPEPAEESFLSRHRKPILLAASLLAICFLTLNLINQRMGDGNAAQGEGGPLGTGAVLTEDLSSVGGTSHTAAAPAPRVIPRIDSLATASIDPAAARGFEPMQEVPAMPERFSVTPPAEPEQAVDTADTTGSVPPLAAAITPLPTSLESPVQVEMPPAELGPEALLRAAAGGDARAQFEVAAIYTEGRAVAEDLPAAAIWYERAAAQGFAPAQYRLGNLYEHGRGVERDLVQARLWYQRAAEAGNRMSMHNLAALYASGELGEQQFEPAAEWFEQAAQRGMKDSQFNLGMLHARGLGVTQDLEASYKWFSIAARNGDADAAKARDDIARSLDAEAVGRLDAAIAAWKPATIDLAANFAPIGTWSPDFDPGAPIADRDVIRSVQSALAHLGFDVGTPDGLAGPKTTEAIREFERATGMSERGEINPRLLAVLGSQPV
ncbi:MAG TPA: peptidoglycan-binding protein [Devosiaceae bacterium]|jgi:localization factor PodJL|nr:peptidoglycan-binding protein [Devosiaceae bacterium]